MRSCYDTNILLLYSGSFKFLNLIYYEIQFLFRSTKFFNFRLIAMCKRLTSLAIIIVFIKVIKSYSVEKTKSKLTDFFCSSVIDSKVTASTTHIDTALRKHCLILIYTLV